MNRPLWQILFTMSFAAFAATRVLVGHALQEGSVQPALLVTWGLVLLLSAVLTAGVLLERSWPVSALTAAVGALLVVSVLLQGSPSGPGPDAAAGEILVIAAITGALGLLLQRGRGSPRSRT